MRGRIEKKVRRIVASALNVPVGAISMDTIIATDFNANYDTWARIHSSIHDVFGCCAPTNETDTPKVSDIVAGVKPVVRDSGARGFRLSLEDEVRQAVANAVGIPLVAVSLQSRLGGDVYTAKEDSGYRESNIRRSLARKYDIDEHFIAVGEKASVADAIAAIKVALESDVDFAEAADARNSQAVTSKFGFAVEPVEDAA